MRFGMIKDLSTMTDEELCDICSPPEGEGWMIMVSGLCEYHLAEYEFEMAEEREPQRLMPPGMIVGEDRH